MIIVISRGRKQYKLVFFFLISNYLDTSSRYRVVIAKISCVHLITVAQTSSLHVAVCFIVQEFHFELQPVE